MARTCDEEARSVDPAGLTPLQLSPASGESGRYLHAQRLDLFAMSSALPPTDAEREWHVLLSGERRGPYTQQALYDVLDTHPAGWRSPVWRPGMLDWRPAREVPALLQNAATATHARGAALFPDAGSDPVLATQPLPSRRVAPESAATTRDLPVYSAPRPAWRRSLLAAVLGALVAISGLFLLRLQLSSRARGPAPSQRAAPSARAPAPALAPKPSPREMIEIPPPALPTSTPAPPPASSSHTGGDRPVSASKVKSVRVRARWAPVRASGDVDAKVLCSLPRGAVVAVSAERPGTHARWFAVSCDGKVDGWVHENFLAQVRR